MRRGRGRRYALLGGAAVLAGALAYKAYSSDALGRGRSALERVRAAVRQYVDALATGADVASALLRDLQAFLASDSNELPPSLRQLARLLQSQEATATAAATAAAVYTGISGAVAGASRNGNSGKDGTADGQQAQRGGGDAFDRVLAAVLSDRGQSLVGLAVSMGAKGMVAAYVEASARAAAAAADAGRPPRPDPADRALDFLSTSRGQQLAVLAVAAAAGSGTRAYMETTLGVNLYEDLFESMAKPRHLDAVKQCMGSFARELVGAALSPQQPPQAQAAPPSSQQHSPRLHAIRELSLSPGEEGLPGSRPESDFGARESSEEAPWREQQRQQRHDDLDSDSILHAAAAREASGKREPGRPEGFEVARPGAAQEGGVAGEWVSAVRREIINVAGDPNGREVMRELVGTAVREAARGTSSVLVERTSALVEGTSGAHVVIFMTSGVLMAWLVHLLLRLMTIALIGR